jgi:RNA ligase (TIGR02306 family)
MAQWKVTREKLELFPHPDPAVLRLELGKAGQYQVVVGKGLFQNGSTIIFVPEKSILPDAIADDGDRRKHLVGDQKNRVKAITLQKELSMGTILDDRPEFADIPLGEDISHLLGITKWEAPIPKELEGKVFSFGEIDGDIHRHDVEIYNLHAQEFEAGEAVIVTEKVCGTQGVYVKLADGKRLITAKGLIVKDQFFVDGEKNAYTIAGENANIFGILDRLYPGQNAQVFGEVVPFVKGFNYGFKEQTLRLFRVDVGGETLALKDVPAELKALWVPIVYEGPFDIEVIRPLKEGSETVSGKALHKKEGIVVAPAVPRKASKSSDKFRLYLKLLNSKYAPSDDDIN